MTYYTLNAPCTATLEIKKSHFLGFGFAIDSREQLMFHVEQLRNQYPDARHVCYGYIIGDPHNTTSAGFDDDGEPSGTAGKPILNVLQHKAIGHCAVIVVRYFGGIKLGTSGLIVAYKAAAAEAIAAATILEKTVDDEVTVLFEYPFMNDVMRIVKEEEPEIVDQLYDMDCRMTLRIRRSCMPRLRERLLKVETARLADQD